MNRTTGADDGQRVRRDMAEAIDLASLHGTDEVDQALKRCADAGRFGDDDGDVHLTRLRG